jgi:hypothetical protein
MKMGMSVGLEKVLEYKSFSDSLGYELKWHKPWFNEECLRLLYQRMQAEFQWL